MIAAIIIVALAFYWLLIETDYLRVNLAFICERGASCPWHLQDDAVDYDMRLELVGSWQHLDKLTKARFISGAESPLCGWGYAYQYRSFNPDYKIDMAIAGVKYSMTIKEPAIIKDIMRVNKLTKKQIQALA